MVSPFFSLNTLTVFLQYFFYAMQMCKKYYLGDLKEVVILITRGTSVRHQRVMELRFLSVELAIKK